MLAAPLAAQERLLVNGHVFTANPRHPIAECVAIRGKTIVAVGARAEAAAALGPSPEIVDLGGKTLLPGLIDSHVHALSGGLSLISATADENVHDVAALAALAIEAKRTGRGMRGDVLQIGGVPLEFWSKIHELNARFNSGEFASLPVFLQGMDGHTGWANRLLLARAAVDQGFIRRLDESARRYYGLDPDLTPNGFAADAGLAAIRQHIPAPTPAQWLVGARAAVDYLHSLGITAWVDPSVNEQILDTYRLLAAEGRLTAHVAAFVTLSSGGGPEQLARALDLEKQYRDVPGLSVSGIKIFADGVAEYPSQTAALSLPYANSGARGDLLFEPARFAQLCVAADKAGLIVHVHAIGDRAVTETLNGIAAARRANGDSGLLHTITHLQFVQPADFPRFKLLGVIAAFQLFWASADADSIDLLQPYLDPSIYKWQYPARSLYDAGATISGASDWSVSTPDVFQAMYVAETRKGPKGVLDARQAMPREAMLYAYTLNAARAMNQQSQRGSIEPGKDADFTLVDRDVLTVSADDLRATRVLWTMVGGGFVYRAN